MSKGTTSVLVALAIAGIAALLIWQVTAAGYLVFVALGVALLAWNFEQVKLAMASGLVSGLMCLLWLFLKGTPVSQVIALPGFACFGLAYLLWGKNKLQSFLLVVLGLALLIFSQYVRVVLLGL